MCSAIGSIPVSADITLASTASHSPFFIFSMENSNHTHNLLFIMRNIVPVFQQQFIGQSNLVFGLRPGISHSLIYTFLAQDNTLCVLCNFIVCDPSMLFLPYNYMGIVCVPE